jgi:leucyl aminopeptidase (aminopeptidase T)
MKETEIRSIDNIFRINLKVKKNERILILSDEKTKDLKSISKTAVKRAGNFSRSVSYVKYKPTGCHGTEPSVDAWRTAFGERAVSELRETGILDPLLSKTAGKEQIETASRIIRNNRRDAVDAVVALSYYSTSHTRFRSLLNDICGTRYASMPLFDRKMLEGPMMVDWKKMENRTKEIAKVIRRYENIEITTPNGTMIRMSRRKREVHCDTGMIDRKGTFSNLPAGEVFMAPLETTAEGVMVLDWGPTRKFRSHIVLKVSGGMVRSIDGEEEYVRFLEDKLNEREENRNIAELGIGTNEMASRPDNILESEKILGTIHIALGDNSSFGGTVRTPFHQDFVFFQPTLTLFNSERNRKVLMKDGVLLNER